MICSISQNDCGPLKDSDPMMQQSLVKTSAKGIEWIVASDWLFSGQ
jgi:hypothetical protein